MEQYCSKVYELKSYDMMFDDYLKSLGLNFLIRKLVKNCTVRSKLVKIDDKYYEFHISTTLKSSIQKFCPGRSMDVTTMDGRKIKNIFTIEENKLIEMQIESNRTIMIIREFFKTEMLSEIRIGEIITKQRSILIN
ncbi:hypothetical protein ACKWTF_002149 [Chironomus riparius]